MDKRYNINEIELKSQSINIFNNEDKNRKCFTVILPPPNVTGSLHVGHALNSTLQDIIVRYHKMLGYDVLWQPGTDHAGIATQMLVERDLRSKGICKDEIGQEEFVSRVWGWKEKNSNKILQQLSKLGCLCDWDRARFTMDPESSEAVVEAFIDLYNQGLIYKSKRLVNWDCVLQTAISDLEVNQKEVDGKLYYIKYPLVGKDEKLSFAEKVDYDNFIKSGQFLVVATTRPETLFGDVAIAINPDDSRLDELQNCVALIPGAERCIPIIVDDYVDPGYGSGLVKITPGHDFNDCEVGQRHGLVPVNVLNADGTLNSVVPVEYQGLDRFAARQLLIENLYKLDLLEKVEDIKHAVPYGDRSDSVIEPMLTDQWMLDVKPLAAKAIKVVEGGQIKFVPENWTKVYLDWMYNIQPWCISRQLWWGHRIPIWYDESNNCYVSRNIDEARVIATKKLGKDVSEIELVQENDVLDTWFSSGLWPMTTLNWPQQLDEIKLRYPTDVLFTGFDIIFFWVARMIMMGLYFQDDVPFKTVYIHGLVCDEHGQKMSKSRGNVIDPSDIMSEYGADALRFALTISTTYANDICLSKSKVDSAHKFITKIWNLIRFADMNGCFSQDLSNADFDPSLVKVLINQWIVHKTSEMVVRSNKFLKHYRFNDFADNIYHFIWDELCDWYVELAKIYFKSSEGEKIETQRTLYWVIKQSLLVLNTIMPQVTSYLLDFICSSSSEKLVAKWPEFQSDFSVDEVEDLIVLIKRIRSVKFQLSINSSVKSSLIVTNKKMQFREWFIKYWPILSYLCNLSDFNIAEDGKQYQGAKISNDCILILDVSLAEEVQRLKKELEGHRADKVRIEELLSNQEFASKAPQNIVLQQQNRLSAIINSISDLEDFINLISDDI